MEPLFPAPDSERSDSERPMDADLLIQVTLIVIGVACGWVLGHHRAIHIFRECERTDLVPPGYRSDPR